MIHLAIPVPICPKCRRTIPRDDVKIGKGTAHCRDCDQSYSLSDLACADSVDLQKPPKGAWYTSDARGTVFGANIRNPVDGVGLFIFALLWNGFLTFFIYAHLISTLQNHNVHLPGWLPNPINQNAGKSDWGIGFWLMISPHVAVGLGLLSYSLTCFFGHTEIRINRSQGIIFTGIGCLGWKKRFDASQVKNVRTHENDNSEGVNTFTIVIEINNGKHRKLGSMLTEKRRQFLLGALQKTILK